MTSNNLSSLLLVALVLGCTYLSLTEFKKNALPEFEQWKIKFNIKYDSQFENSYREKIFLEKKAAIELHNSNPERTYNKGLNRFSAMTHDEFKATYLTLQSEKSNVVRSTSADEYDSNVYAGDIDWRVSGAVTDVKDQGRCGSCWSFSSTGGLEGLNKIKTGTLKSFSEQQLMDCVTQNSGCHGGQMRRALLWVRDNGILQESEYPYKAVQGDCLKPKGNFKLQSYVNVSSCTELANALTKQPIMVGLNSQNWHDYESGIFTGCSPDRGVFNHGVLVVGMSKDYWIVKNSWTSEWGENGYIRLAKGDSCNVCDDGMLLQ